MTLRTVSTLHALAVIAAMGTSCDRRTAEEKGRDLASEKLDMAKGVADVVKEKGGTVGKSAGQGLGELVKGVGSGVKDVAHPPVNVDLESSAAEAGVSVKRANEGQDDATSRAIDVYAAFARPFRGRLALRAFDEAGTELGEGVPDRQLDEAGDTVLQLAFHFPTSVRFSHVKTYRLRSAKGSELTLHESLREIEVSQLKEGTSASAYVKFTKQFAGALELRAYDGSGAELARSSPSVALKQSADSATYVDFSFDARSPLARATKYEVRRVAAAKK